MPRPRRNASIVRHASLLASVLALCCLPACYQRVVDRKGLGPPSDQPVHERTQTGDPVTNLLLGDPEEPRRRPR